MCHLPLRPMIRPPLLAISLSLIAVVLLLPVETTFARGRGSMRGQGTTPSSAPAKVAPTEGVTLTDAERTGLIHMREEEKLARDVYDVLGATWNLRVFSNISRAEQTHMDAVGSLLARAGIPDPVAGNAAGVFTSPELQQLYTSLVAQGRTSLTAALTVGATIEDLDIYDLDTLSKQTSNPDILATYRRLNNGSQNHLRAFVRNLSSRGSTYAPQYISQSAFDTIVSAR